MTRDRYNRIFEYLKAHESEMIRDLSYLCAMPSVRSESEKETEPFGKECAVCLEKTAELFRENGFETKLFAESGYALSFGGNGESDKVIGLYAHTDVVPVNEKEWTLTSPFEPRQVDDCLVARGVIDNKNAVVASLYIMKALRELGIKTNSKLQIFIGSNEETGMADVKAFVREQKLPQVNIVPDAGYPAAIGQKGILRFNVRAKKPFSDIVNIAGGSAYNIVLNRVVAKVKKKDGLFEEMLKKADDSIEVADGNFITVTATGVSAHAAKAYDGENALGLLTEFLLKLDGICYSDKEILSFVAHSLSDVYGKSWGIDSYSEFFCETTCSNGIAKTVDGCLEYTFDVRHNDVIPADEMVSIIEEYFDKGGFTYNKFSHTLCMKRDENSMPIKTFVEGYRRLTGEDGAKAYVMGGGTYANYLEGGFAIGVCHNNRESCIDLPEGHGGAHQADEIMSVPAFLEGTAIMAELLLEIDDNM